MALTASRGSGVTSPTDGDHSASNRHAGWAWLAGVVAGLAGLASTQVIAWLLTPLGDPVSAVSEFLLGLFPSGLINFGKDTLRFADKPVLLIIVALLALAITGLSGRLEYGRRWAGAIGPAVLCVLAVVAIATRQDAGFDAFPPAIIGTVGVCYPLLRLLIGRLRYWAEPSVFLRAPRPRAQVREARRNFMITSVAIGAASIVVGTATRAAAGGKSMALKARSLVTLPKPATPAPPVPAGADLKLDGLTPYVTGNGVFYRIDTAFQVPIVDPDTWSLTITGLVEHEVTISWKELLALPLTEHYVTLTCVSNEVGGGLAGNARWLGYPVRELLKRAVPRADADMVLSASVDGFTAGTPLDALTDPHREAIIAVGMNGQPLPAEHGFPARMVVPGLYGYVSATKWIHSLKVTTYAGDQGYWTPLGWSARGPIKLASRIDTPTGQVKPGKVPVAGVAWAQHTGISRVEVRVDDKPWQTAKLAETTGPDTWRQWVWIWDAEPGHHTLTVRATDADGRVQTSQQAPPAPNGATGWDSKDVTVG
ncbi:putative oxidoreductase [Microlunatus endophyticus]|uniref:Oxidoreductase n=1 Tax=Microlunatus endophyticus TaxID=1716077 RepID=A0A917SER7_9ACTN|nr:molybdopterin-dependent oxidoreductase [Microlunatus endophyticus]GGL71985.1 putative oxidoreductase [Microlunatus endophyticus]